MIGSERIGGQVREKRKKSGVNNVRAKWANHTLLCKTTAFYFTRKQKRCRDCALPKLTAFTQFRSNSFYTEPRNRSMKNNAIAAKIISLCKDKRR